MSTARNRFGVSILVGFVLAVLCSVQQSAYAEPADATIFAVADENVFSIDRVMNTASSRAQLAVALGAGVPMVLIGMMVRRRNQAEY
jgi:hypothetical protein